MSDQSEETSTNSFSYQGVTYNADRIAKGELAASDITGRYALIYESSGDFQFNNLMYAINLLVENGWEPQTITHNRSQPSVNVMYCLLKAPPPPPPATKSPDWEAILA